MNYEEAKDSDAIKTRSEKSKSGLTVTIEHWATKEVPPSVCYRATCGATVVNHSMTVHADKPKKKEQIQSDHEDQIAKLVEDTATNEQHRTHIESLQ